MSLAVSNSFSKMEEVSLKLTNIWFDFRQAVNKAGMELDKLDQVHSTVMQLSSELDNNCSNLTKKDHMAAMIGEQPSGDITILAPNICKNKGNYFKRLISEREKAVTKAKKRVRKCKECGATTHDSRTCDKKKKKTRIEESGA